MYLTNSSHSKVRAAIKILDTGVTETKNITRYKGRHCMIERSVFTLET